MCLKLTARATEQRRLHRSGVLIVKLQQFLTFTSCFHHCFEQVNADSVD